MKAFALPALFFALALPAFAEPWRSSLYPEDWQPGFADAQGRFFHDFSYAGYHNGEAPIPDVPQDGALDVTQAPFNADKTGATDATEAIQAALDQACANPKGGVVYLPAGTYRVAPRGENKFALNLWGDHVVLRGEGAGKTFIYCDSLDMRAKDVILVRPKNPVFWTSGSYPAVKLSADVLTPSLAVPVEDASSYKPGDLVLVRGDITQRFIDQVGMTGTWKADAQYPSGIVYCRRVVSVDPAARTLTVDIPLRGLLRVADNARVTRPPANVRMLSESGLEDFSLGMKEHPGGLADIDDDSKLPPGTPGYAMHRAAGIALYSSENCWVRRVDSYRPPGNEAGLHLQSHGIRLWTVRKVTVDSCHFGFPQFRGEGGNGYMFTLYGNDCLVKDCEGKSGRHNVSFGEMSANGNVILRFHAVDGRLPSDFHMFLSLANLFDSAVCEGDFVQSITRGVGHGVTTTQSIFWNTEGRRYPSDYLYKDRPNKGPELLVQSKQWGDGYVIGTKGPCTKVETTNFAEGLDKGADLVPQSLYEDQLRRRLEREKK